MSNESLKLALDEARFSASLALKQAKKVFMSGAKVVVRTQRHGHPVREHTGTVERVSVDVSTHHAGVSVYVRNDNTGKVSRRYLFDVGGRPQVRIAALQELQS